MNISNLLRHYAHRHVAFYFGRMDGELMWRERRGRMLLVDQGILYLEGSK